MKILNENLNKDLLNKKNESVDNIRSHDFAKREMMTNKSESPESFRHNNIYFPNFNLNNNLNLSNSLIYNNNFNLNHINDNPHAYPNNINNINIINNHNNFFNQMNNFNNLNKINDLNIHLNNSLNNYNQNLNLSFNFSTNPNDYNIF